MLFILLLFPFAALLSLLLLVRFAGKHRALVIRLDHIHGIPLWIISVATKRGEQGRTIDDSGSTGLG